MNGVKVRWGAIVAGFGLAVSGCVGQPIGKAPTTPRGPKGGPATVGVILPLSGDKAMVGRRSLDGIECAAGKRAPCAARANITIVTRDSAGSPVKATEAVDALVQQEHVAAIIGPIDSPSAKPAAERAEQLSVPFISLSPGASIARIGPHTYRVGINPAKLVHAIARYAVKERGFTRFAILHPESHYGTANRDLFRNAITSLGGQIVVERPYKANIGQIVAARDRLSQMPRPPKTEVAVEVTSTEGQPSIEEPPPLPKLAALDGVDAVFIPDSPRSVASLLKAYGPKVLGGATILGVNSLNDPAILAGGQAVEGALFADGFFRDSAQVDTQQFVSTFAQAFNHDPTRLEAEGYDALQFVAEGVRKGGSTPEALQRALQRTKKLHGVTGTMRFTSEGDVDKEVFILTIAGGRIQEVGRRSADLRAEYETGEPKFRASSAPLDAERYGGKNAPTPGQDWDKYAE
ncbi:MAG: penicillin-binding protein activator [Deltaproteobacteria bacterium]|nr:penicillin-binding protein activator [Deltaproteobacteria bacterium]